MIFQGDTTIKTMLELSLEDMAKNPWLIDDMLSDMVDNRYLNKKYGQKQIDACKEWFKNNKINIYMAKRTDKYDYPCITIGMGPSSEKEDMKTMADQSTEEVKLLPKEINKPIPYILRPFTPDGYSASKGLITVNQSVYDENNSTSVNPGMILVDPATGNGWTILAVDSIGIYIQPNLVIEASSFGVVPQYQFYTARIERSFFQESYNIGCHAHGDPQALLWLWSIVLYSILRYKESLLESNGFTQTVVNNNSPGPDEDFTTEGGESAWSRYISISGMVENSWIKTPRRTIESINLREKTPDGYVGGIKILSNLDVSPSFNLKDEVWYTEEDVPDDED